MKLSFVFINSNLDKFIIIVYDYCNLVHFYNTYLIPISINLELSKK